jgi:hypothetical protein
MACISHGAARAAEAVRARTGKRAPQAHDVRSPPDYILFQMDQAGSLRPADADDREIKKERDMRKITSISFAFGSAASSYFGGSARSATSSRKRGGI